MLEDGDGEYGHSDCGFPRAITETDIEMLCNCSFAGLFHYDIEKGAEKIAQLKPELESL